MLYLTLKTLHVGGALLFLGAGLASAWYKFQADRSGDLRVVAWCQRQIVLADWLFTTPSAVILPVTGLWMALRFGFPLSSPWLVAALVGFGVSGLLWVPAVVLQLRMKRLADEALARRERDPTAALSPEFERHRRVWIALGVPAFVIALVMIWVMVTKTVPFVT